MYFLQFFKMYISIYAQLIPIMDRSLQAAKLGFYITGPPGQCIIETHRPVVGPNLFFLVLLVQIIHTYIKI